MSVDFCELCRLAFVVSPTYPSARPTYLPLDTSPLLLCSMSPHLDLLCNTPAKGPHTGNVPQPKREVLMGQLAYERLVTQERNQMLELLYNHVRSSLTLLVC